MNSLLDQLDLLAAREDFEQVERAALEALKDAGTLDAEDLWRYVSWARFESGNMSGALDAARQARDPLYTAKACFHQWMFEEAREALSLVAGGREDVAEANWYAGLVAEFSGEDPMDHYREDGARALLSRR